MELTIEEVYRYLLHCDGTCLSAGTGTFLIDTPNEQYEQ